MSHPLTPISVKVPGGGLHLVNALQLDLPAVSWVDTMSEGEGFELVTEWECTPAAEAVWQMMPGEHLMIMGSNGVGKTAVTCVIAGLWPGVGGWMEYPDSERGASSMFVVPQQVNMVVGRLLDQWVLGLPPLYSAEGIH